MHDRLIHNIMSKRDAHNSSFEHMVMDRIRLSQEAPLEIFGKDQSELCLYTLAGSVDMHIAWEDIPETPPIRLGVCRRTVQEPQVYIFRMPSFLDGPKITMVLTSYAADIVCVWNETPFAGNPQDIPYAQRYTVQTACHNHHVGTGTHERWVREVVTPPGYSIHCGETLNIPGGWSSWPSHATPDEVARHAEHEELFFVITPGYGLMHCDGLYPDGTRAPAVQKLTNGQAIRTPLGSHEIVFSPGDWGYYAWFYRSFLQKQYNKYATDGVKTYVK